MAEATRALGHARLADVSKQDLRALSREVAEITGVPLAYRPRTAGLQEADRPSPLVADGRTTLTAPGSAGDGSALRDGARHDGARYDGAGTAHPGHPQPSARLRQDGTGLEEGNRQDGSRSGAGAAPGKAGRAAGGQAETAGAVGAASRDRGGDQSQ